VTAGHAHAATEAGYDAVQKLKAEIRAYCPSLRADPEGMERAVSTLALYALARCRPGSVAALGPAPDALRDRDVQGGSRDQAAAGARSAWRSGWGRARRVRRTRRSRPRTDPTR
jgi:hypothetical protein